MKSTNRSKFFIGLMSGTSADAIDAALVEIGHPLNIRHIRLLAHHQRRWPVSLRRKLLDTMAPAPCTADQIAMLDMLTAQQFAAAVKDLLLLSRRDVRDITAIGSHGQTIAHTPPEKGRLGATLQIGNISVIATLTGIPTVGDFRPADMALGGQGAPLVPAVDAILFPDGARTRSVHNIGGISNLTWLPSAQLGAAVQPMAFDTGPGNCLIDSLAQKLLGLPCDRDGSIARRGVISADILKSLSSKAYFRKRPPKSTGRESFGALLADQLVHRHPRMRPEDLLATATELTALTIADAYRLLVPSLPDEIVFCGGGVNNTYLMGQITRRLGEIGRPTICNIDSFGITNAAREAMYFAVLAAMTLRGIPGNLPSCTGAARSTILGAVARPLSAAISPGSLN